MRTRTDPVALSASLFLLAGLVAFTLRPEPGAVLTVPPAPAPIAPGQSPAAMAPAAASFPGALLRCQAGMTLRPLPPRLADHGKLHRRRSS